MKIQQLIDKLTELKTPEAMIYISTNNSLEYLADFKIVFARDSSMPKIVGVLLHSELPPIQV